MKVYDTKEYRAWIEMRRRCYNPERPSYRNYGGRGIQVCDKWRNSFAEFLSDVGYAPSKLHSLDRLDNDGDYEPTNVAWRSQREQSNNTRNTVKIDDIPVTEFAAAHGLRSPTVRSRILLGWPREQWTKPSRGWRRKVEFQGRSMTEKEWAAELGIPPTTLRVRIRNNVPLDGSKPQEKDDGT